jgi:hypothetical protein
MERNIQKVGLVNLCVLLAGASASFVLARLSASFAGQTASVFIGLGFLIAAVSYFQMRLEERERLEKLEFDELSKSRGGSALFATEEAELFAARRAREQFERFIVPAFTVFLFLLQAGRFPALALMEKSSPAKLTEPLVAMALFVCSRSSSFCLANTRRELPVSRVNVCFVPARVIFCSARTFVLWSWRVSPRWKPVFPELIYMPRASCASCSRSMRWRQWLILSSRFTVRASKASRPACFMRVAWSVF